MTNKNTSINHDIANPAEMTPAWSDAHCDAAIKEGWDIFDCGDSDGGPWQLQHLDDASAIPGSAQLHSDQQAWLIVARGYAPHHVAARAFLQAHNPKEWQSIREAVAAEEAGSRSVGAPLWSAEHSAAARREGWDLFEATQHSNSPVQIRWVDDSMRSDMSIWRHVLKGTASHHEAARAFLQARDPQGWERINDACARLPQALRSQALALLQQAQELDGLKPFIVTHSHEWGNPSYVTWARGAHLTEADAEAVLESKYEPEKGESLAIEEHVPLSKLVGLAQSKPKEEVHSVCGTCDKATDDLVGCPDGAEVCRECFDAGAH